MDPLYVWAMFYASVVSMELHPGNKRDAGFTRDGRKLTEGPSLANCAKIADAMMQHYLRRRSWQQQQQESEPGQDPQSPEGRPS